MTIHLGWWVIPTVITIAMFAWAFWPAPRTGYGSDVMALIAFAISTIVSLLVWLVWALLA